MTESTAVATRNYSSDMLPTSGDPGDWSPQEHAIMAAAGLVRKQGQNWVPIPRPDAEAFLHQCRRTRLDPIARQIYCIERGGKYTIQVSIDGARLVAERTGEYRGQTPKQWTDGSKTTRPLRKPDGSLELDGNGNVIMVEDYLWTDVWLDSEPPKAARVGVYREGFVEPLMAVANFDAYSAGGPMWRKMPALMIAKCAEMLALRAAFPNELSGVYSSEEMDQADSQPSRGPASRPATRSTGQRPAVASPKPEQAAAPSSDAPMALDEEDVDWFKLVTEAKFLGSRTEDDGGLRSIDRRMRAAGVLGKPIEDGATETFADLMLKIAPTLPEEKPAEKKPRKTSAKKALSPEEADRAEDEIVYDPDTGEVIDTAAE